MHGRTTTKATTQTRPQLDINKPACTESGTQTDTWLVAESIITEYFNPKAPPDKDAKVFVEKNVFQRLAAEAKEASLLREKVKELGAEIKEAEQGFEEAKEEFKKYSDKLAGVKQKLDETKSELTSACGKLVGTQEEFKKVSVELGTTKAQLSKADAQIEKETRERNDITRRLDEARQQLSVFHAQATQQQAKLDEEITVLKAKCERQQVELSSHSAFIMFSRNECHDSVFKSAVECYESEDEFNKSFAKVRGILNDVSVLYDAKILENVEEQYLASKKMFSGDEKSSAGQQSKGLDELKGRAIRSLSHRIGANDDIREARETVSSFFAELTKRVELSQKYGAFINRNLAAIKEHAADKKRQVSVRTASRWHIP